MNPQVFDINKLRIASPCSVGWDSMAGDELKRFCGSCELNVYNVAGMTESEVRKLVSIADGRLCVRLTRRSDGSVLTRDCPVGLRGYRKRVARLAGATMAAIIGLFSISYGQDKSNGSTDLPKTEITKIKSLHKDTAIFGKVIDPAGVVVSHAEIILLKGENQIGRTASGEEGEFRIAAAPSRGYRLKVVPAAGFKNLIIEDLSLEEGEDLKMILPLEVGEAAAGLLMIEADPVSPNPDPSITDMRITPRKKP